MFAALANSVARVYLGAHNPLDVVVGVAPLGATGLIIAKQGGAEWSQSWRTVPSGNQGDRCHRSGWFSVGDGRVPGATTYLKEIIVSNDTSGPKEGLKGVIEDVKGKAKEAVGSVTGNEDLKGEGEAQQDKAAAQREVAKKEAEAEKSRAEAAVHEAEQKAHQN